MLLLNDDDGIEGVYECPRCEKKIVCEYDKKNDIDTRDYINDLSIVYMENENNIVNIDLKNVIEVKNAANNEVLETVTSMSFSYPTLNDCIRANQSQGFNDEARLQFAIYIEALKKVNGKEVDGKFNNRYGMNIFEKMGMDDYKKLNKDLNVYGMDQEVEKHCRGCGKDYKVTLNISNFFASALNLKQ